VPLRASTRTLRQPDGSIDLARITAAAPAINYTSALVAQTTKTISALPAPTWLSSIVPPTPARYTRSPTLTTP